MKTLTIIGIVLVLVVLVLLIHLSRNGLFSPVKITEQNIGPYLLVYEKHIGDYKNVGPVMDKIYYDLKDKYDIETTKGFGLYYDNPREVDAEKLRSIIGCIVEEKEENDLKNLISKYGIKSYPASKSVVAEFPYHGKVSIMLGIFKVYPKLSKYINENRHPSTPVMEIYDQPKQKTLYISSIDLSEDTFNSFLDIK